MGYLLALDQGTSSSRSVLFDLNGSVVAQASSKVDCLTPHSGWVEQDAMQLWSTQIGTAQAALAKASLLAEDVLALAITNQRETSVLWNRRTGAPLCPALVWQDRRTASTCKQLKSQGLEQQVSQETGLLIDPYFSATKIKWLLDTYQLNEAAQQGDVCFGTVESWLIFKLTGGLHVTDVTNASRTLLLNTDTLTWSQRLCETFGVPMQVLGEVVSGSQVVGKTAKGLFGAQIPIAASLGDQQAALFGQNCFETGQAKNTYGTGCFLLVNTGETKVLSEHRLLSSPAWQINGRTTHALEGSVFMAGAIVDWLVHSMKLADSAKHVDQLAAAVDHTHGVFMVPAFTGLGAPHWNSEARALICGLSRGSTREHVARAALESIAFQVADVVSAMNQDGCKIKELKVDGGVSRSDLLMQFQADLLGVPVLRPVNLESTAFGVACMAGLCVGAYGSLSELKNLWTLDKSFEPTKDLAWRQEQMSLWQQALRRAVVD